MDAVDRRSSRRGLVVRRGDEYVTQVYLPLPLHGDMQTRHQIPTTPSGSVVRAYWMLAGDGAADVELPRGVRAVLEIRAADITAAEDQSLDLARHLTRTIGFFAGAPWAEPRIERIARCDHGYLVEQWDYWYDDERHPSTVPVEPFQIEMIIRRLEALDSDLSARVRFAIRWHSRAAQASDPVDKYLAVWLGLEAISPSLHERWHQTDRCEICSSPTRRSTRSSQFAGIEHLIALTSPELLNEISFDELRRIRNNIVHALDPADTSAKNLERAVVDLLIALGRGLLTVLAAGSDGDQWESWLPRDSAIQPVARAHLTSRVPLTHHNPYMGRWVPLQKDIAQRVRWIDTEDQTPMRGEAPALSYDVTLSRGFRASDITHEYAVFEQDGVEWTFPAGAGNEQEPQVLEWRPRPRTPAWRRASELGQKGRTPGRAVQRTHRGER